MQVGRPHLSSQTLSKERNGCGCGDINIEDGVDRKENTQQSTYLKSSNPSPSPAVFACRKEGMGVEILI